MKKAILLSLMCIIPAAAMAQEKPMNEDQKTLYFLGYKVLSRNLKQLDLKADENQYLVNGLADALNNVPCKVDDSYGPKINDLVITRQKALVKVEKDKGKAFQDTMAKEKSAVMLSSGAIFIPIKEGTGAIPKPTDMVRVHYHGTFTDGKVFDSSVDRKKPAEFPLNGVIPCWTEGVQKLKVGGKAKLVCPSEAAYGDRGMPGSIPGGATLVFEVELLDILNPAAAAPAPAPAAKPAPAPETKPAQMPAPKTETKPAK